MIPYLHNAVRHNKIYYANARSLRNKMQSLEAILSSAEFCMLLFVETFLARADTSAKCLVGSNELYTLFRCDRNDRTGGGVAIFCRHDLNPAQIVIPENLSTVEAICVNLKIHSHPRILCIYRPPNCTLQYHEKMCHVISHCARNCKNIVMFGDFNLPLIQWSNFTFPNTMPYNTFAECINENSLTQHVNFPTRGSNILDLVFTADPLLVSQVTSQDHFSFLDSVSDHTALVLCLNVRYEPATETPIEKHFDFRRANMFLLKSLIVAVNWEMLLANTTIDTNIDTMIDTFYDTFWSICEKCVPIVISSRRINKSNYPQHIVKLGSKCKRLSKCKHIKPRGILQWRTAQREYMLAIQHFVNNRECTVLQSGDSSAFYRYINQRRACKHGIAPLLDANSELAVTDHDKADILNAQFTSIFTVDDGILPQVETRRGEARILDHLRIKPNN